MTRKAESLRVHDSLRGIVAGLLALLLLWVAFPGGLYSDIPQFVALWHATLVLAGALLLGLAERRSLVSSPARLAGLGVALTYALSLAVAIASRLALQEIIRHSLFLAVLISVSELVRSAESRPPAEGGFLVRLATPAGVSLMLWLAAVALSVGSLVASVGLLPFEVVKDGRLYTFAGYPNTAGALAGAGLFLGLGLRHWWRPRTGLSDALLSAGQWAVAVTFLLTMSRGAWLVAPGALVIALILWPRGHRLATLGDLALTGVAAVAVAPFLPRAFGSPGLGSALLAAGLAASLGAGWLARRYQALSGRLQAGLALAAVVLVVAVPVGLYRAGALPQVLAQRLTGFSLSERSAMERLVWTKDAFEIVKDNPVLGVGGGGWASVYFQYQSYGYTTREVHNDILELWLETGTVGLAAWLALLGAAGWAAWKLSRAGRPMIPAVAAAVAMVVFHSALDFDMALGGMGVFLWACLGLIDGVSVAEAPVRGRRAPGRAPVWPPASILGAALLLCLLSLSLALAARSHVQAMRLFGSAEAERSYAVYRQATSLDPWDPYVRIGRVQAAESLYNSTGDQLDLLDARAQAWKVVDLEPETPYAHSFLAAFLSRHGELAASGSELETAMRLQPWNAVRYEQAGLIHLLFGQAILRGEQEGDAPAEFQRVVEVRGELAAQAGKEPSYTPEDDRIPSATPRLDLYAGEALVHLGRVDEAVALLEQALKADRVQGSDETGDAVGERQAEAALWLSVIEERRGNAAKAARYFEAVQAGLDDADAARAEVLDLLRGR